MPKERKLFFAVLLAAITLGTAWAVRGQFGHTQGATWAGACCALVIILLSGRSDWQRNAFTITSASALGWGAGGIISYGLVVAYGQGLDFANVYYGQAMLFFIGSLFGFLGGGLFAVSLGNTQQSPVNWWALAAQMLLGGIATHLFLVKTISLRMTPPRGDGWAACLGMALMLAWYLCRNRLAAAQRVALLGALGAGWGFAFGNFLRVAGISSGLQFHYWNVMEYSIGFFGGGAVTYAVFTSNWPNKDSETVHNTRFSTRTAAILLLTALVPLAVWQQSFTAERLGKMLESIGVAENASAWITLIQAAVLLAVIATALLTLRAYGHPKNTPQCGQPAGENYLQLKRFFTGYMAAFITLSFVITGAFFSTQQNEQYLYPLNLIVVLLFVGKIRPEFVARELDTRRWFVAMLLALLVLAALAYVSIHMHGELWGAQQRF